MTVKPKNKKKASIIVEKEKSSEKFFKRYRQYVIAVINDEVFIDEIKNIRKELKIPSEGFKQIVDFEKFVIENKKDNFSKILKVIHDHDYRLETNPIDLLNFYYTAIADGVGSDIYLRDNNYILGCPTLEIYENYLQDKPFIGVFDYILFGKAFKPASNLLAIIYGYSDKCIVLAISPNTNKRDILELWPEISKEQKKMPGYSKNKNRYKKRFEDGLESIKYDKETERIIQSKGLKGIEASDFMSRRKSDFIDSNYYSTEEQDVPVFKNEKKLLQNRKTHKFRVKKLIGPN